MTTGKTIALTRCTFVGKVMSLLYNILSRLVIAFLPRSKHLLISWLQSPSAVILQPEKIKSVTVSIDSPSICHEIMGPDAMILVFWMLSFKPAFSLSSFTFIKRLFSSSSLYAIRVVSPAYLRLLIFLPEILTPACASSSPHFTWCTLRCAKSLVISHPRSGRGVGCRRVEVVSSLRGPRPPAFPTHHPATSSELMLLNCGVGEDSWESVGLQGDPTSPS